MMSEFDRKLLESLRKDAATQPKYLYHGTNVKRAAQIEKDGLIRRTTAESRIRRSVDDASHNRDLHAVFLSDTERAARFFALAASMEERTVDARGELIPGVVFVVDRKRANDLDVWFSLAETKLAKSYGGREWFTWGNIPVAAVARTIYL
jgi:hypothetical protein